MHLMQKKKKKVKAPQGTMISSLSKNKKKKEAHGE